MKNRLIISILMLSILTSFGCDSSDDKDNFSTTSGKVEITLPGTPANNISDEALFSIRKSTTPTVNDVHHYDITLSSEDGEFNDNRSDVLPGSTIVFNDLKIGYYSLEMKAYNSEGHIIFKGR